MHLVVAYYFSIVLVQKNIGMSLHQFSDISFDDFCGHAKSIADFQANEDIMWWKNENIWADYF